MKNRYEFSWYRGLEIICMVPIVFAAFPIPFVFPAVLIGTSIHKPGNIPVAIIYFSWLIIGGGIIFYFEKKYP